LVRLLLRLLQLLQLLLLLLLWRYVHLLQLFSRHLVSV
jgi:hypothetical protein